MKRRFPITTRYLQWRKSNNLRFAVKSIVLCYLLLLLLSVVTTPTTAYFTSHATYKEVLPEMQVGSDNRIKDKEDDENSTEEIEESPKESYSEEKATDENVDLNITEEKATETLTDKEKEEEAEIETKKDAESLTTSDDGAVTK